MTKQSLGGQAVNEKAWFKKLALLAFVGLVVVIGAGGYWWLHQAEKKSSNSNRFDSSAIQNESDMQADLRDAQYDQIPKDASIQERSEYLLSQASAAMYLKNYDLAISRYNEVLSLKGQEKNDEAIYGLGRAYAAKGQNAKAKKAYEKLIEMYKDSDKPNSAAAMKLIQQKIEAL